VYTEARENVCINMLTQIRFLPSSHYSTRRASRDELDIDNQDSGRDAARVHCLSLIFIPEGRPAKFIGLRADLLGLIQPCLCSDRLSPGRYMEALLCRPFHTVPKLAGSVWLVTQLVSLGSVVVFVCMSSRQPVGGSRRAAAGGAGGCEAGVPAGEGGGLGRDGQLGGHALARGAATTRNGETRAPFLLGT
jgi:hypothetical protein